MIFSTAAFNPHSPIQHPLFTRLALKTIFKFIGEPKPEETINQILIESAGLAIDS